MLMFCGLLLAARLELYGKNSETCHRHTGVILQMVIKVPNFVGGSQVPQNFIYGCFVFVFIYYLGESRVELTVI